MNPVDIIVPVYDGFEEVKNCLDSLLDSAQQTPVEYVVIHDAGPSAEIAGLLRELESSGRITLLENDGNLGFVRTANRGMALHPDRDVVLLNSDTVVSGNWLDRLRAHATGDVGTVTPFSNNAEICSFPRLCQVNELAPATSTAQVDASLAAGLAGQSVDIPTAVGFCMYIRRDCLEQVGPFDAQTFGLGYGEENDFCLRARQLGWRHLLAADCFVAHVGGVSFSERKQALVANAMQVLDQRYPAYHGEIAEWIAADPPYAWRCKGLVELLRNDPRQKVLAVTHHMGGGTEKHVRELADATDARALVLLLKPYRGSTVRLSLGADEALPGLNFDWAVTSHREALLRLLAFLRVGRLHVHHVLGLEDMLPQLLQEMACPYDITLHDYFLIDGNPTLTDENGLFQRERALRGAGCNSARVMDSDAEWQRWRQRQQALLAGAERVFAPSRAALELYRDVYPLENAIVSGHTDLLGVDELPVNRPASDLSHRSLRVLVLGALGIEKGGQLLEDTALLAQRRQSPVDFALLGYGFRPLDAVNTLGAYRDVDIDRLIAEQAPDLIWFPCRWPETYSYTLSAALRSGCPILVPDIGSFPERVVGRPSTWVQAYQSDAETYLAQILQIRETLLSAEPDAVSWQPPAIGAFRYDEEYSRDACAGGDDPEFTLQDVGAFLARDVDERAEGRRMLLLRLLLWLKQRPVLAWLVRRIPLRWQRALKRRLSSRPLHDLGGG